MSAFLPQEFIGQIRDGHTASHDDIRTFVNGIGNGDVSDAQAAAFTMAVFFKGFAMPERTAFTLAVRDSGYVLSWPDLGGPVLDKHSTGGIGDNVSLILGPAVAACGGYVPMISGQGLGHTGGTLDKFSAIPGYNVFPDNDLFIKTVRETGCAIIGQTGALAPVDKKLYAIRSATASVESNTLITASILSKKLAAGLEGLVLDVKCGNGAFMPTPARAAKLARSLVNVAVEAGLPTSALITDMNQPLASAAGNAVEMRNALDHLTGAHRDPRLHSVVIELGVEMLIHGKLAATRAQARTKMQQVLDNGKAAEVFAKMVNALGGPADILENPDTHLKAAPLVQDITAEQDGVISQIHARDIGLAVIVLGGGRKRPDDSIDVRVGFDHLLPLGTKVSKGDVLARIHARNNHELTEAGNMLKNAYTLGEEAPEDKLIIRRILPTRKKT
jgi:thymidine phosphorylase